MRIEFLTKNYTVSQKLNDIIVKKIEKLDKFFEDDTKIKIMLKKSNDTRTLELTIMEGSTILRSEVSSDNMYDNIDIALPKLEKQIIKHRKKLSDKSKKFRMKDMDFTEIPASLEEEKQRKLVRSKVFELTPMTVEDAIEELELVGHSFYVFSNKLTMNVNVVYKRNDGDYGLIETTV